MITLREVIEFIMKEPGQDYHLVLGKEPSLHTLALKLKSVSFLDDEELIINKHPDFVAPLWRLIVGKYHKYDTIYLDYNVTNPRVVEEIAEFLSDIIFKIEETYEEFLKEATLDENFPLEDILKVTTKNDYYEKNKLFEPRDTDNAETFPVNVTEKHTSYTTTKEDELIDKIVLYKKNFKSLYKKWAESFERFFFIC